MHSGEAFNVIIESGEYFPHYYIMRSSPYYYVPAIYLNVASINGHPNAHIAVTPNFNPNGTSLSFGILNNHPLTVRYDTARQMWYMVNQDGALFSPGAAFNVWLLNGG